MQPLNAQNIPIGAMRQFTDLMTAEDEFRKMRAEGAAKVRVKPERGPAFIASTIEGLRRGLGNAPPQQQGERECARRRRQMERAEQSSRPHV